MDRVAAFLLGVVESIGSIDAAYFYGLCVSAFLLLHGVVYSFFLAIWKAMLCHVPRTWQDMGALATILAFVASGVAAWFAYRSAQASFDSLRQDKNRNKDAVLCEEAIECLRLAHETLISERDDGMPAPNRMNWLTAARLICRFNDLKARVTLDEYLYVLDGKKFIWAQKNNLELQKISRSEEGMLSVPYRYFETLDPQSVRVVLDFSSWDDSTKDWIEQSEFSDHRIGQLRNAFPAYNIFLQKMGV